MRRQHLQLSDRPSVEPAPSFLHSKAPLAVVISRYIQAENMLFLYGNVGHVNVQSVGTDTLL